MMPSMASSVRRLTGSRQAPHQRRRRAGTNGLVSHTGSARRRVRDRGPCRRRRNAGSGSRRALQNGQDGVAEVMFRRFYLLYNKAGLPGKGGIFLLLGASAKMGPATSPRPARMNLLHVHDPRYAASLRPLASPAVRIDPVGP